MRFLTATREVILRAFRRPVQPLRTDDDYERALGDQAEALIQNDVLMRVFVDLHLDYIEKMGQTDPSDWEGREYWHRRILALQDVLSELDGWIKKKLQVEADQAAERD